MSAPSATITITRRSPTDVKQRHVFVALDRVRIGVLAYGESITRDVPPAATTCAPTTPSCGRR